MFQTKPSSHLNVLLFIVGRCVHTQTGITIRTEKKVMQLSRVMSFFELKIVSLTTLMLLFIKIGNCMADEHIKSVTKTKCHFKAINF